MQIFSNQEERARDAALEERMSALSFVRPEHLDIVTPDGSSEASWGLAGAELRKMSRFRAPKDKLVCILNCCRVLARVVLACEDTGVGAGADGLLPQLIYVTIRCNPPNLHSNVQYISRFTVLLLRNGNIAFDKPSFIGTGTLVDSAENLLITLHR